MRISKVIEREVLGWPGTEARPHHVLPQTGWVSYRIRGEEDVEGALELFRLNYERLTARKGGR